MQTLEQMRAESDAQVVAQVFGLDVTRGQLSLAFDQVADKANWKNPIDRVVRIASDRQMAFIREAVIFFTGSVPTFTAKGANKYRVTAAGYYNTIGA